MTKMNYWYSVMCVVTIVLANQDCSASKFFRGRHKIGGYTGARTPEEKALGDNPHVTIDYFTQVLDHFDPQNTATWKQKFWINDQFYKPGGPIFVMIGGEGPTARHWIDPDTGVSDWLKNAQWFNALCFQLEHRYYGDSHPTADMSLPNLKYLSSRQALNDIATFVLAMKVRYNIPDAKVITFGGSYPGALSAWFRLKYPHIVDGAVATSGPLHAKVNFVEFLEVVSKSLNDYNPTCLQTVADATQAIADMYASGSQDQIDKFAQSLKMCQKLDVNNPLDVSNFYSTLAGSLMETVQYSNDNRGIAANVLTIPKVCEILTQNNVSNAIDRYVNAQTYFMAANNESCFDFSYQQEIDELKNESWTGGSSRQWIYQTCTEFGYYQSSDSRNQPFGHSFDGRFSQRICSDVFGSEFTYKFTQDAVQATNTFYGSQDIEVTKVVFPNGSLDPWHVLGLTNATTSSRPTIYIKGTAHCANMYPPRNEDIPPLISARLLITQYINAWISK